MPTDSSGVGVPTATAITFVRHGETDWNAEGRWQGWSDRPLTERGVAQARLLAGRFAGRRFDAVYASDLQRAVATAAIADGGAHRVIVDKGLREQHFGSLEGALTEELLQRQVNLRFTVNGVPDNPVDGESARRFAFRIRKTTDILLRRHAGQSVLVVAHGGVLIQIIRRYRSGGAAEGILLPKNCASLELRVGADRTKELCWV